MRGAKSGIRKQFGENVEAILDYFDILPNRIWYSAGIRMQVFWQIRRGWDSSRKRRELVVRAINSVTGMNFSRDDLESRPIDEEMLQKSRPGS